MRYSAIYLGSIWAVYGLQYVTAIESLGIRPRSLSGLWGLALSPLLHGNLIHIIANSLSLVFLAPFFFLVVGKRKYIFFEIWALSGAFTWIIGRSNSIHIGASSVIFGMIGLLLGMGFFERNPRSLIISLAAFVFYGGALWGLLPTNPFVSWEGHLGGFIAGLITARYSLSDK